MDRYVFYQLTLWIPSSLTKLDIHTLTPPTAFWTLSLSLNDSQTPTLSASQPDATLQQLGIRSGDLIWVHSPCHPHLPQPMEEDGPSTSTPPPTNSSMGDKISAVLLEVLDSNQDLLHSHPASFLLFIVHATMLETGFILSPSPSSSLSSSSQNQHHHHLSLSKDCWVSPSLVKLHYTWPDIPTIPIACTLQCSFISSTVLVALFTPGGHERHLLLDLSTLKTADSVGSRSSSSSSTILSSTFSTSSIQNLWREVKDTLSYAMLISIHIEAGLQLPPCLSSLPIETIKPILTLLQPIQLAALSATCREFRNLASMDDLWKPFFIRDFPQATPYLLEVVVERGYKVAYGRAVEQEKEAEGARRRWYFNPPLPRLGGGGGDQPPFYPPRFPGIIGGDYDRLPRGTFPSGSGVRGGFAFGRRGFWLLNTFCCCCTTCKHAI